jgi:hypothetical protein
MIPNSECQGLNPDNKLINSISQTLALSEKLSSKVPNCCIIQDLR